MNLSHVYRIRPKIYRFSIDEGLSFLYGGIGNNVNLVTNLYMSSGVSYPSIPNSYLFPISGDLLIAISGSVDSNITFNREYAFDDNVFHFYDAVTTNIVADQTNVIVLNNHYSGYWRFTANSDSDGYYTIGFRIIPSYGVEIGDGNATGLIVIGQGIVVGPGIIVG